MPTRTHATHRIFVNAPAEQAYMFFTPAGEELWVDGWAPRYANPADGTTQKGMVFSTGQGSDLTVWLLLEFDRIAMRSLYVRCTPATRVGTVEVACTAVDASRTQVDVAYTLTALSPEGEALLESFEGQSFTAMIEGWASEIDRNLPGLLAASIR
jgi:hypothetical protein